MSKDEAVFLRRRQEKKERRARRKLSQLQESKEEKPDRSLIRADARASPSWTGGHGTTTFQHSDFIGVAGRTDFLKAVNRDVLDATIEAGLALTQPERARVELSFAIVRRARLSRTRNAQLLDEVIKWNTDVSPPLTYGARTSEWGIEDIYLLRATAAFLNRSGESLESQYITDLEWLRSNSSDGYIRAESRLLLTQNHLEEERGSRQRQKNFLDRAARTISNILKRSPSHIEACRELLNEILQDDIYEGVSVPRSRVRLASSWLDRDPLKALHAIDPRRPEPLPPSDEDNTRAEALLAVEKVCALAQEGAASTAGTLRRKNYARALSLADFVSSEALEQADILRLAKALQLIAATHPDGSWRAGHLLFHLCPDPRLESVSGALACVLHRHYLNNFLERGSVADISNARIYIDAAFDKLPNNSREKLDAAAAWLITSGLYTGATSLDTDPTHVLDYLDDFLPHNHLRRIEFLSYMGMALSGSPKAREEHIDRLVGYWEEQLKLVEDAVRRGRDTPQQLAAALENTAIANRLRAIKNEDSRDLARALKLSRRAFDIVQFEHDIRTAAVYSYILNQWSKEARSPEHRVEALHIQTTALRELRKKERNLSLRRDSAAEAELASLRRELARILEVTFPIARSESEECFEALTWLTYYCLDDNYSDLKTPLTAAALLCESALASDQWLYATKLATKAIARVERTLTSVDNPYTALYLVQGLSSIGAVAFAHLNKPSHAAQILERGAALRTRIQLERRQFESTPSDSEAPPSSVSVKVSSLEQSHQLKALAASLSAPLVYLAATEQTGLAVVVTSDTCRSVLLPALTLATVNQWLELTSEDLSLREESTGIPVRGARGEQSPTRSAIDTIIAEATKSIQPLQTLLAEGKYQKAHLVAIGQTAGVPWTYVFEESITINPSATILNHSRMQETTAGPRVSITAPSPCHHADEHYKHLKYARKEGLWLSDNAGFDSTATGPAATREAFNRAVKTGSEILHIAAHGSVNTRSWGEAAHLLWADDEKSTAEMTSLPELMQLRGINVGTVFLAACWGGAPNRTLPDESISFPTAFLSAGAKAVIAPLWPIDDDVAYEFSIAFYEYWKLDGYPPTTALRKAANEMRDAHPDSSTWAAFMLAGHNEAEP
ncbi:CHAT domain-containing protein [Arthrobacter sp. MAHUQ-56]